MEVSSARSSGRLRSGRQLAAVQFLSSISLDGSRGATLVKRRTGGGGGSRRDRHVTSSGTNLTLVEESSDGTEDVFGTAPPTVSNSRCDDGRSIYSSDSDIQDSERTVDEKLISASSACYADKRFLESSSESLQPTAANVQARNVRGVNYLTSIRGHKFNGERIILVNSTCQTPLLVCSIVPFLKCCKFRDGNRRRHASGSRPLSSMSEWCDPFEHFGVDKERDGQEVSYGYLLASMRSATEFCDKRPNISCTEPISLPVNCPSKTKILTCRLGEWNYLSDSNVSKSVNQTSACSPIDLKDNSVYRAYNPNLLDNPELVAGKHRTLLPFSSYVTSIIEYVKPSDLKKEINDKFRARFPHIRLTLSKLRSIKREMRKIPQVEPCVDLVTVAQAYVYFEKLILLNLINKENRKSCAAASLLLSAKLNDVKGDSLRSLMDKLEGTFRISRKELICAEFAVLVALKFGLHIPAWEMFPHYQRLLYDT